MDLSQFQASPSYVVRPCLNRTNVVRSGSKKQPCITKAAKMKWDRKSTGTRGPASLAQEEVEEEDELKKESVL